MRGSEFAELRAFAAIVEHGSFARAAVHLGMTASALSQTLRNLESRLGLRLLNRTTRSVAPTDAGAQMLARLLPAIAEIDAAVEQAVNQRQQPTGRLRLNVTRIAAMHFLAPLIAPFHRQYPDILLDLNVEDRLVDIVAGGFDAGVRLYEKLEKDMVAIKLGGDLRMRVVASPAYLARHGQPQAPHELRQHLCLNFRWPTNGNLYRWEFERDGEKLDIAVEGPVIVDEPEILVRAALDSVGIAYLFEHQVAAALADGRLVPLLDVWTPPFPGFYLYYPANRQMPRPLRAFIDFARQQDVQAAGA
ncbi:LysR family transcriptional regulator [Serratia plymuthica]|uniref:LysR family transcriptional regulator n=1 Tax=Serratia plymuthica TaxID=82996 RepID=A0A7T2SUR5_SERPL|nr:LysR family transcriptional regulator [Serratia plymuthica]QPS22059.1 LysR family transcriptional regulator [Serratia plymuthica]QPS54929.1 LysR family transcriptional regulator [Serratia plymuthica]QPS63670.1 LysR family transcriptional regulator [Serratia plymuthica]RKS63958.1 LysR family transcriptional regulator [Serratia plymuthica]CAI1848924.1 D-malate degradation protein R [Serratia plymuthica]